MTRRSALGVVLIAFASIVQAQHALTGTWEGETRGGASLALRLSVEGTVLTGTLTRDDQPITISDGKVSKNAFTFQATLNDRTERFSGEVAGDELRIWLDRQGPSTAIVLRRVKDNEKAGLRSTAWARDL